jgi:regulator of sigma E protease
MSLAGIVRLPPHEALWRGTVMTGELLTAVAVGLGGFLADAFTMRADFTQVAGPVGIVGMVGEASSLGIAYLLTFTAFISLNLAVINMLPFPALDGGRLVFVAIEKLTGRMIKPVIANTLNFVGFALLIVLMIAVTYNDILRLIG